MSVITIKTNTKGKFPKFSDILQERKRKAGRGHQAEKTPCPCSQRRAAPLCLPGKQAPKTSATGDHL